MDLKDVIRGLFGFGVHRTERPRTDDPPSGSLWGCYDDEDDYDDGDDCRLPFGNHHGEAFPNPHDPFRAMDDFMRMFESMFDSVPHAEPFLNGGERPRSLRDFMLKYPDGHLPQGDDDVPTVDEHKQYDSGGTTPGKRMHSPFVKEDNDLDNRVSSERLGGFKELLPREPKASIFRSYSIIRKTLPDGAIEERRTVYNDEGKQTTVKRFPPTRDEHVPSNEDNILSWLFRK
uniref:HCLS1-associated protein X-1 n=1 Tax=Eptatretus burgeri TaxID=7764 RepID=A0A8C4N5F5_EPTBU